MYISDIWHLYCVQGRTRELRRDDQGRVQVLPLRQGLLQECSSRGSSKELFALVSLRREYKYVNYESMFRLDATPCSLLQSNKDRSCVTRKLFVLFQRLQTASKEM
jgi:hypothetical protein